MSKSFRHVALLLPALVALALVTGCSSGTQKAEGEKDPTKAKPAAAKKEHDHSGWWCDEQQPVWLLETFSRQATILLVAARVRQGACLLGVFANLCGFFAQQASQRPRSRPSRTPTPFDCDRDSVCAYARAFIAT